MSLHGQQELLNTSGWVPMAKTIALMTHMTKIRCMPPRAEVVSLMLFARQKTLLTLLEAIGQSVGNTDFQKLLFLFARENEESPSYDFVPYKYGCFSFTSYADKRRLTDNGLLSNDENHWHLTEAGSAVARALPATVRHASTFLQRTGGLRGDSLIAEVYRRYPYYATRSEILDRVLPQVADRERVAAHRPKRRGPGLLTIGYEGKTLETYLNILLGASVTMLCDVRRNPLSRKYGFSKTTLSKACENLDIVYVHLPDLGIASERRRVLVSVSDYQLLFDDYERDDLPHQGDALQKIRSWIDRDGHRVALTCYEADPAMCHRHCVAAALEQVSGTRSDTTHL